MFSMKRPLVLAYFCYLFFSTALKAEVRVNIQLDLPADTIIIADSISTHDWGVSQDSFPSGAEGQIILKIDSSNSSKSKNNKVVAAILAFPFPFGMLGLHRLYLGTKPYIPFVYIGTIGGCFLILPFIDFCTIIFSDDETFHSFENNRKVFMWSH